MDGENAAWEEVVDVVGANAKQQVGSARFQVRMARHKSQNWKKILRLSIIRKDISSGDLRRENLEVD
jgi:hypothetical protein